LQGGVQEEQSESGREKGPIRCGKRRRERQDWSTRKKAPGGTEDNNEKREEECHEPCPCWGIINPNN